MTLVTVKDSSAKAQYQYINYKRTAYRQSAEKKISQHRVWRLEVII